MSRSFYYRPVVRPPAESFGLGLAHILASLFGDTPTPDYQSDPEVLHDREIDKKAIPFLMGAHAALGPSDETAKDILELVAAIRQHGTLVIEIER